MCVVTYETDALDDVNRCFDVHDCITLEPINIPCRDASQAGKISNHIRHSVRMKENQEEEGVTSQCLASISLIDFRKEAGFHHPSIA